MANCSRKKGEVKIFIRAHNGIAKTLKVSVDDYANLKAFSNLDKVEKISKKAKAFLIAIGVNEKGYREVLDFKTVRTETYDGYKEFFNYMKKRGLEEIGLVTSDDHNGLVSAIKECFTGASWQRWQTHFSRNMLEKIPKKYWNNVKEILKEIYTAKDLDTARRRKDEALNVLDKISPSASNLLDESFDDITQILNLPLNVRRYFKTPNHIERLNENSRRRERVIRIFPNEGSVMRILGNILIEIHEDWMSGRRYFIPEKNEKLDKMKKDNLLKQEEKKRR